MRETVTISLAKPIITHNGPIKKIVLREPTFEEYLVFGDPYVVAGGADGTPFGVENVEVIKQYIDACLVEPKDPALLAQAGAIVARKLKNALLGFFRDAEEEEEGSATAQTSSSSADTAASPEKSSS